jgi:hypothetical protein
MPRQPGRRAHDATPADSARVKALFTELPSERIVDGKPAAAINVEVLKRLQKSHAGKRTPRLGCREPAIRGGNPPALAGTDRRFGMLRGTARLRVGMATPGGFPSPTVVARDGLIVFADLVIAFAARVDAPCALLRQACCRKTSCVLSLSCLAPTWGIPENQLLRGATMEFYQSVQNRAAQTATVIRQVLPTLSVGGVTVDGLLGQSQALDELAQRRDDALADFDAAGNAENQGFV